MLIHFTNDELKKCFDFATSMRGNHNPNMIMERKDWEIFRDDFRGKLGEIAVVKYLSSKCPSAYISSELDFSISARGQWDITDLIINNNFVNVKSIKENSNFLLVETLRYDNNGNYTYLNNDGNPVMVDYYILVKVGIMPDVQTNIFTQSFYNFCNDGYDPKLKKGIPRKFYAQVLGTISHNDFWNYKVFAPKGIRCDKKNLDHLTNGGSLQCLPSTPLATDKKNNILQQDNYVIGRNNLTELENVFK